MLTSLAEVTAARERPRITLFSVGQACLAQGMHHQLDELLAARGQTEKLLDVVLGISSDLKLDATLDRIVDAAIQLTGARYGARGRPRARPRARLLPAPSVPVENSPALRLADLADHPAAAGFPPHRPPMHAFLGVPITVRGTVFGSLYVTHDQPGRTFSEADEIAARVLASAAAVAIDNAQPFERVRASARWTQDSREITTALVSGSQAPTNPLHLIAARARAE